MSSGATGVAAAPARVGGFLRGLDRPLTSYYLILSATWLLLALGLVMVLSASSVELLESDRSPFSLVQKQALWTLLGLPVLWVAMRLPATAYRRLAYPVLIGCLGLLALVPVVGVSVLGNKNCLPLPGGMNLHPSELAKLALILWSADLLARK
ncbi:MAG: FtsW/RodA/SpoVE family cell cycle protein, partial [Actinomycetes bacterium]